jgi:hypothetical protein
MPFILFITISLWALLLGVSFLFMMYIVSGLLFT